MNLLQRKTEKPCHCDRAFLHHIDLAVVVVVMMMMVMMVVVTHVNNNLGTCGRCQGRHKE
jgi:hypothetical protein